MKKIAVILSGCGVFDGSEIHEATLALLNIRKAGASYQCAALDENQFRVSDHKTKTETAEKRNMLTESARIARGNIVKISQINPAGYDAVIFPGGSGATLNFSSFGKDGANAKVNPEIEKLVNAFYDAKKPIGAICIAPVIIARTLASKKVKVSVGNDAQIASAINSWGAEHVNCSASEICFDTANRVVTTPAYMLTDDISEVNAGIEKLVNKILSI